MNELSLHDAQATLSVIIDRAKNGEPSIITRDGRREAVVISVAEWERLSNVPSFDWLLMNSPLEPGDIPERVQNDWREIDF